MKKLVHILAASATLCGSIVWAQTNPTPWSLNTSGNYSFTSFSPAATSFPASMVIHQMNASPPTLASAPAADIPLPCTASQASRTNVWGLGVQGIGLRSNPSSASAGYTNGSVGEVIVSLSTLERTGVQVSFKAGTYEQGTGQSATFRLRCQFRTGTSGAWSELGGTPVEYEPVNSIDSVNMGPYSLPAAADNQAVVQVRWIYYHVAGAFNTSTHRTHRAQLDDISITSLPIVHLPAFAQTCPSAPAFALTTGTPAGGYYSGPGVTGGNTFNPSLLGPGTYSLTYHYTDIFGMSNSALQTINLDYNVCTTQLSSGYCGGSGYDMGSTIYCDPVASVQDYEWEFTNTVSGLVHTRVKGNNYHTMGLWGVSGLQYGSSYNVRVRAKILNQWRNWGPACAMTLLPAIPATQLNSANCGAINLSLADVIAANTVIAATAYQYEFTNGFGFYTLYTKNNNSTAVSLWAVPGLQYGQSYTVRVRSQVGGNWSAFGNSCTITLQGSAPVTQLATLFCGATNVSLGDVIYCNAVAGATNFHYEFVSGTGVTSSYTKNNNATSCALWAVPGLQYGNTYTVRVKSMVGGVWSAFGNPCTLTMQSSIPATKLNNGYCSASNLTTLSTVYCAPVAAATNYIYEFSDGSGFNYTYTRNSSSTSCGLWVIPGLANGKMYHVRVKAQVGGVWGAYGQTCTIILGGGTARMDQTAAVFVPFSAKIFPNPVADGNEASLTVYGAEGQAVLIRIMDFAGKVIAEQEVVADGQTYETILAGTKGLAPGMYLLQVNANGNSSVSKFIVH